MPFLNRFPFAREAHEIYPLFNDNPDKNFACRVCGCTWQRKPPHGKCAGVHVYEKWEVVPQGLYSATAIYRDHKRKLPENALPLAAVRHETSSFTPLYRLEQADPNYRGKRKSTIRTTPIEAEPDTVQKPFGSGAFDWLEKPDS